jgi:tRNA threonylcarbamoyladenosine biosynthesis protein TsaE
MTAANILRVLAPLEAETQAFAISLAPLLQPGDWVLLNGPLGAGKTTFARSLLQALGHYGDVPSPTFTLIQTYDGPEMHCPVWHVDLYRLDNARDVAQLGLDDAGDDVLLLVEWPERLGAIPDHALRIDFSASSGHREIALYGNARWHERLRSLA